MVQLVQRASLGPDPASPGSMSVDALDIGAAPRCSVTAWPPHRSAGSSSSRTSPATRPTCQGASSSTLRSSPATCSRRSSAAWTRPSGWPSSRATRRSSSSRMGGPMARSCVDAIEASLSGLPKAAAEHRRRRPAATAPPVAWHRDSTSSCSSTMAPTSTVASRAATSSPGSDVILVHRLLKGEVAAEARSAGFALFTAAAVEALGIEPRRPWTDRRRGVDRAPRPASRRSSGTSRRAGRRRADRRRLDAAEGRRHPRRRRRRSPPTLRSSGRT